MRGNFHLFLQLILIKNPSGKDNLGQSLDLKQRKVFRGEITYVHGSYYESFSRWPQAIEKEKNGKMCSLVRSFV